jgi:hypothetical protein
MTIKKITWQKFICPLNNNLNEFDSDINIIQNKQLEDDEDNIVETKEYDEEEDKPQDVYAIDHQKILSTPFGLLTLNSNTLAINNFDFWIMHTNFDLTQNIAEKIARVPGVETLEILTRYRARLGFPKSETIDEAGNNVRMFDSMKVKHEVEESILYKKYKNNLTVDLIVRNLFNDKVLTTLQVIKNKISKNDYWAVYILPNGFFEILQTNNQEEFHTKLNNLVNCLNMAGGYITTYKDYESYN